MSDEYLWDRSGAVDEEVDRLERTLAVLRPRAALRERRGAEWWRGAAAAVLLVGVSFALMSRQGEVASPWRLADAEGGFLPQRALVRAERALTLEATEVGRIGLAAGTEIVLAESGQGRQRLELRRGRMEALIWAPPSEFVVDAPGVRAVDLGCKYELSTDGRGEGELRVEYGWVALEALGHETFIPAGARCRTRGRATGLPVFEDAAPAFLAAVEEWERGAPSLDRLLGEARARDAMTLWHLLQRVETARRGLVYDRMAALVPELKAVPRAAVVAGRRESLDACWNALGWMDTGFWRQWKGRWGAS